MKLGLTLTGADERTPIDSLLHLATAGAEIGLLWTFSPDGRPRYPSIPWINQVLRALPRRSVAVHVCGARARDLLLRGRVPFIHDSPFLRRVQVNGSVSPLDLEILCGWMSDKVVITQHDFVNNDLVDVNVDNHALLVDGSGGRGQLPSDWYRPLTVKPVGFAGGLGPDNLAEQLPRIAAVAQKGAWIDCESSLRTDEWFDVARATRMVELWKELSKDA